METNVKYLADGLSELRRQLKENGEDDAFVIGMCQQYIQSWLICLLTMAKK